MMETAKKLLSLLESMNIEMFLDQGRLKTKAAPGAISGEIAAQIRTNRDDLIALLSAAGSASGDAADGDAGTMITSSQRRLWLSHKLSDNKALYNLPLAVKLKGVLDEEALLRALRTMVERHQPLRTRFVEQDGEVVGCLRETELDLVRHRLDVAADDVEALRRRMVELAARPFDLSEDSLFRADLVQFGDDAYVLLLCMHHIITDGWSCVVLIRELEALYNAGGAKTALPELPVQFSDHARRLASPEQQRIEATHLAYWREQLHDLPPAHALPLDHPRPRVQSYEGAEAHHVLDDTLTAAVRDFAVQQGTSVYCVLQTALTLTLSRWSNEKEILIGTSSSGRDRPELERLVGFFVNPLILRNRISDDATVAEHLARSHHLLMDVFEHQQVAFERIVGELQLARSASHAPIFQIMFEYQSAGATRLALNGLDCQLMLLGNLGAKYDIEITATEQSTHLLLRWVYAVKLFDQDTIRRLQRSFEALLTAFVASPDANIGTLPFLPADEAEFVARASLGPRVDLAAETFPERFAAVARRLPDEVAVEFQGKTHTYAAIESRANKLARHLRSQGLRAGARAAVHLAPGPELVVAILGVLKAGGAYVPIDPTYPRDRIAHILDDADAGIVLCGQDAMADGFFADRKLVTVGPDFDGELPASRSEEAPDWDAGEEPQVAYVLYTSGSTGKPKGAIIGHAALNNYLDHATTYFREDVRGAVVGTSIGFDATITSLLTPLLLGKRVLLLESGLDAVLAGLKRYLLEDAHLWLFKITPAHLSALAHECARMTRSLARHVLVIGGEQLDHAVIDQWRSRWLPEACYVNEYGPTEATVGCSVFVIDAGSDRIPAAGPVPIGKPIANTGLYVLNEGRLAPVGVVGELHIAGAGLADGYLNLPEASAKRFVRLPQIDPGQRFYRTGDLVRLRSDGDFEFVERCDDQVKVRGYRVEIGEIESALRAIAGVREIAVLVQQGGAQRMLVAYVQPVENVVDAGAFQRLIRQQLAKSLPEYMVPSAFELIDELPLTVNGKVDKAALPKIDPAASAGLNYVPPQSEFERALCALWQKVIGLDRVGIHDNFLEIGGNSLMFVRMRAEIEARFGCKLEIVSFFEHPTIAEMARHMQQVSSGASPLQSGNADAATASRSAPVEPRAPIAVIAMAGRFPDADSPEALWNNLCKGHEALHTFTEAELIDNGFSLAEVADPAFVRSAALLKDVDLFDAELFRMTPREAEILDPQQRLLLECSLQALESAGYGDIAKPRHCGVFFGCGESVYMASHLMQNETLMRDLGLNVLYANSNHYLSTRIAYKLNLTGPAVSIATACSTSLVAIHQAVISLRQGECDMALAGGVRIYQYGPSGYQYREGGIVSPDGHCRAFDADARGTRGGNGVGVVALKRLDDALRDGDNVLAVIRGTAINNDGSQKVGYTAPSVAGQVGVIEAALHDAGLGPQQIHYVETHGTGTPLGDPIEFRALHKVFRANATQSCALGTLKPNIGHLDAAAGVAGVIKAVAALSHGQLPPSINYVNANPQIDLTNGPFYVNTRLQSWHTNGDKRRAGVSSFGIGGTNAHVILEEAPSMASEPSSRPFHLLLVSACSAGALQAASMRLATYLDSDDAASLADVAYTLQTGRTAHAFRRSVVCADAAEAVAALTSPTHEAKKTTDHSPSLIWMFPGQGSQRVNMALDLYASEPVFRETLDACAEGLIDALGLDIRELLYPSQEPEAAAQDPLTQTRLAQPTLFAVEYSLAKLLQSYGLQPEAMIGHSLGEYVAACLAGVFSLEDGLKLVAERGRLMQSMPEGRMLSVPEDEQRLRERLSGSSLDIAAINDKDRCVVAGSFEAIEALRQQLAVEGIDSRELETSHAFHSVMMEPMLDAWRSVLKTVVLHPPTIPCVSNLSGGFLSADQAIDIEYWIKHLRSTVRFADGLDGLMSPPAASTQARLFLEVGPGQVLSGLARRRSHGTSHAVVPVLGRSLAAGEDARALHQCLGQLWQAGVSIEWSGYHAAARRRRVPLPTYPFERRRFWVNAAPRGAYGAAAAGARSPDHQDWFYVPLWRPRGAVSGADIASPEPLTWLLMSDEGGVGRSLADALRRADQKVIVVRRGDAFERIGQDEYVLVADDERQYGQLVNAIEGEGARIDRLAHLWSLDPVPVVGDAGGAPTVYDLFEAHQVASYFSLMFAIKVLMARVSGQDPVVHAVTRDAFRVNGSEVLAPECATVVGLCRVAPQEYPNLRCQHIDFSQSDREGRDHEFQTSAGKLLFGELMAGRSDKVVAFRRSTRWTQTYEKQKVSSDGAISRIKRAGVYVITGGLGKVGYAIADHLAGVSAKLVIVVRDDLPPRPLWSHWVAERSPSDPVVPKLSKLLALEYKGAQLLVCKADVADEAQMLDVFERAEVRFGKVDGVIHCAGQPRQSIVPLEQTTIDSSRVQFLPKVKGAIVLQRVLRHRNVDFCVLMSSLSAVLGGRGLAAYAAANAYMDAFAAARHAQGDEAWLSINWDSWNLSGAAGASSEYAVSGPEGAQAMAYALSWSDVPQLVHSTGDLKARMEMWVENLPQESTNAQLYARAAAAATVAPSNIIESQLVEIWQQLLGIQDIGVRDPFFEAGGDSLLATIMVGRINQTFDVSLPIRIIFEEETIERIALKIDEITKRPPQGKPLALKRTGDRAPLFCLHPGSGFGRPYLAILRHLPADLPVYALEARGLNDGDVLPQTLGDMCADYIDQIQIIQPHGPYHLLGWSFGAIVAHAMAAEMEKRGMSVARLIMIDPAPMNDEPWPESAIEEHRQDLEMRLSGYKDYQNASDDLKKTMIARMSAIQMNNTRLSYYRDPSICHGDALIINANDSEQYEGGELFERYIHGNVIHVNVPYHHNILMTTEALAFYGPHMCRFLDADDLRDYEQFELEVQA